MITGAESIAILFAATVLVSCWFFYRVTNKALLPLLIVFLWILLQSLVSYSGFYTNTTDLPPRFIALVLPPFLSIILLFSLKKGRTFTNNLQARTLVMLHVVRIPVELVLYFLYRQGLVPELLTFEGRNWDILSGLSAPLIYYLYFVRGNLKKSYFIAWNVLCLLLLLNVVIHGILSAPFPFQQFAFEQPNKALLYFPFSLLPGFIVPLVLFAHLASIKQCLSKHNSHARIS